MVLEDLSNFYECYMFPFSLAPWDMSNICSVLMKRKVAFFPQMLQHFLKFKAGVHSYNNYYHINNNNYSANFFYVKLKQTQ